MVNNNTVMNMKRESYWLNEKKDFNFNVKEITETDVLIIGGGMSGIMTAYELSKNSNTNITLVDAGKLARNITAKTSNIFLCLLTCFCLSWYASWHWSEQKDSDIGIGLPQIAQCLWASTTIKYPP